VTEIKPLNLLRCNVTISMLYLLALDRINVKLKLPSLSKFQIDYIDNINKSIVNITYYSSKFMNFITIQGFLALSDESKNYLILKINSEIGNINYLTLVSIDIIQFNSSTYHDLHSFDNNYIKITLFNNITLIGWYDSFNLYVGLKWINLEHEMIKSIELMTFNHTIIDIPTLVNSISNVTYLDNGQLITELFYVINYYDQKNLLIAQVILIFCLSMKISYITLT